MSSATRADRERTRLLTAAKRARGKRSRAAIQRACVLDRLDELAGEMEAAQAELDELDRRASR